MATYNPNVNPYVNLPSIIPQGTAGTGALLDPALAAPGQINMLNVGAQTAANAARIPGATGLEQLSSDLIGQELRGQLPADVVSLLGQQAAERGVATGTPGSPNTNAAYLRALGLTSLQEQQRGEENLSAALGRNPPAPLANAAPFLMTPYQRAGLSLEEQQLQAQQAYRQQALGQRAALGQTTTGVSAPYDPRSLWTYSEPTAVGLFAEDFAGGTTAGTMTSPPPTSVPSTTGIYDYMDVLPQEIAPMTTLPEDLSSFDNLYYA